MMQHISSIGKAEIREGICSKCRGYRNLCSRAICPILIKMRSMLELDRALNKEVIFGASPPSIFVGSWKYPKVFIGPLTPPIEDRNTAIMDSPDRWLMLDWETILKFRFLLFRGKNPVKVTRARLPDKYLSYIQELAMSVTPLDTEVNFKNKPRLTVKFWIREPPTGPSADVKYLKVIDNATVPRIIDKSVSDFDLKADEALWQLYSNGIKTRQLIRLLSAGLLGTKNFRKLVPTEWSITAVDSILSDKLLRIIRNYPVINNYYIYRHRALGNNIQILLIPEIWMFEVLEAWLVSQYVELDNDYELWYGRTNYAENIGGAYYAARLPLLDHLYKTRRQAAAIVFIEIHPEWISIGVWRIREICKAALKKGGIKVSNLSEAIKILDESLNLPIQKWLHKSYIFNYMREQGKIDQFLI